MNAQGTQAVGEAAPSRPAVAEEVRVRAGRGYWRSATVVAVPGPAFNYVWVQLPGSSTVRPCFLWNLA